MKQDEKRQAKRGRKNAILWVLVALSTAAIAWSAVRLIGDRKASDAGASFYDGLQATQSADPQAEPTPMTLVTDPEPAPAVMLAGNIAAEPTPAVTLNAEAAAGPTTPAAAQTASTLKERFARMDGAAELTAEERAVLEQEASAREQDANQAGLSYGALAKLTDPAPGGAARASGMDFTPLTALNKQLAGWLRIDGTVVDYPFVQGTDNTFYLSHLFDGTENKAGTIFVDYRNEPGFLDTNTLLYGHHMKNGSMFASLVDYKAQAYYDAHPTMTLYTPEADYQVDFFAGYIVPIRDEALPCFYMNFADEKEYMAYIAEAKRRSTFKSDVEVTAADRIVTLTTCTYEVYDARYVLQGKLTKITPTTQN